MVSSPKLPVRECPHYWKMGIQDDGAREEANCAVGVEAESIGERFLNGIADIPDYREQIDLEQEYRDFPEEKIWSPRDEVNEWVPFYLFMARSILTFVQESHGISNREAMENSCTGYAEQYITDVLHNSKYVPEVALKTLMTTELPKKLVTRWTSNETELFLKGIARFGKNFASIQKDLLPERNTKDIVDFYYAWKWTDPAKELRTCRRRRRKSKRRFPSIGCIFNELTSPRIVTRSVSIASKLLPQTDVSKTPNASLADTSTCIHRRKRKHSRIVR